MVSLLMVLSALAAAPQFDVQLVDGTRVSGSLDRWDAAQLVVTGSAGRTVLDVGKLAAITPQKPPASPAVKPAVRVDLVDGSQLAAADYTAENGRAKIVFSASEALELPTAEIDAVRFQPDSEATAAEWSRIRGQKIRADVLVTGTSSAIDYHQGAIEDVSGDKARFILDGQALGVKRAKIFGLIYFHAAAASAPEHTYTIVDSAGSSWAAASLKLDGDKIEFTSPGGRATPPRPRFCRQDRPFQREDRLLERLETRFGDRYALSPSPPPPRNFPAVGSCRGSAATRISNRCRYGSMGRSFARGCRCGATAKWRGRCRANSAAWREWPASMTTSARWETSACRSSATARRCWTLALPAT